MNQLDVLQSVVLANGETITYRERPGAGQVVLLVHGNMTSSKHWDLLMDNLHEDFHVIAPDLRGFGGSTYNRRVEHIKDFAKDLKLFVDELGIKDFDLVGWSTGGMVCMQYCVMFPNDCRKLVLFASGSTRGYPFYATTLTGQPDTRNRMTRLAQVEADTMRTKAVGFLYSTKNKTGLRMIWDATIYTRNKPGSALYDAYLDDMCTQRNLADIYHCLNTFNIGHIDHEAGKATAEVDLIQQPTLILYGDRDYVVNATMTQEIIEDFNGRAKVVQLKDCGHSPIIDQLDACTQAIEAFLAE